ncbi:MAG: hypothetical protein J0H82_06140 [Alphaproteobacteria bacterium]|nr:hypothetical protein [Alphaproteobacteria bacterium]
MKRLLIAAAAVLLPALALAHGDAAWIQHDPRYVDQRNIHCCGEHDCERAPADAVRATDEGWLIVGTGQIVPYARFGHGLFWSIDADFWWCRYTYDVAEYGNQAGEVRCLFVPGTAS